MCDTSDFQPCKNKSLLGFYSSYTCKTYLCNMFELIISYFINVTTDDLHDVKDAYDLPHIIDTNDACCQIFDV